MIDLEATYDPYNPAFEREIFTRICPECKGSGEIIASDCCGAEAYSNGDSSTEDYGICSECHDHCTYERNECEVCNGEGVIPIDMQNEKIRQAEN